MLIERGPDAMEALLDWLSEHRLPLVFVASLIDATGLPFPGRLVLVSSRAQSPRAWATSRSRYCWGPSAS
jgi:hypothetical protein